MTRFRAVAAILLALTAMTATGQKKSTAARQIHGRKVSVFLAFIELRHSDRLSAGRGHAHDHDASR